jgi:AcrR family transcriptional regulator
MSLSDTSPFDPGKYTLEALCERIFVRHKDRIRIRKPAVAVANLSNIVQKFLTLTNRKGFHATSLRELADATGLSMGGLYSYFDSKDTLLLMILGEVDSTMREVLDAAPQEVVDEPLQHLRWVIDAHVRLTEVMQPWFVFAYMEAKAFPPAARKAAVESELLVENVVEQILKRGQASGRFVDRDAAMTASLVKPLLQDWYVKRSKYRRRAINPERYAREVTALLEAAVLK